MRSQSGDAVTVSAGGDDAPEREAALTLARLLVSAVEAVLAVVDRLAHTAAPLDEPPYDPYDTALRAAQAGQVEAACRERLALTGEMASAFGALESPLVRLTRAYRRAFDALGAACLLLASDADALPPVGVALVERATQCARSLAKATTLLYTGQGLGTTAHLCAYIGELENQADTLYRGAVSALFGLKAIEGPSGRWTSEHARRLRLLNALEALTDRCEEIADELLLLDYLRA